MSFMKGYSRNEKADWMGNARQGGTNCIEERQCCTYSDMGHLFRERGFFFELPRMWILYGKVEYSRPTQLMAIL